MASAEPPRKIWTVVTDEFGCGWCDNSGSVSSDLDPRLDEKCPMCFGHGRWPIYNDGGSHA